MLSGRLVLTVLIGAVVAEVHVARLADSGGGAVEALERLVVGTESVLVALEDPVEGPEEEGLREAVRPAPRGTEVGDVTTGGALDRLPRALVGRPLLDAAEAEGVEALQCPRVQVDVLADGAGQQVVSQVMDQLGGRHGNGDNNGGIFKII